MTEETKTKTAITVELEIYQPDLLEMIRYIPSWDVLDRVVHENKILITLAREFDINHAPTSFHAWEEQNAKHFLDEIKKKFNDKIVDIYYY